MDINRYSPSYGVTHKHMVKLADYSTEEIFEILYATKAMKSKFAAHENTHILQGVTVALLFGDTSLRTRSALEIGIRQLGGTCVNLPYSENDMRAGENVKDIVNVISRYGVGALVTRGIKQKELEEFCSVSAISVINSTNDYGVPMQTLCDLFTIWEKHRKLEGLKLAYVGKGTSNANSLITGAIKCGMEVSVAAPENLGIQKPVLDTAMQYNFDGKPRRSGQKRRRRLYRQLQLPLSLARKRARTAPALSGERKAYVLRRAQRAVYALSSCKQRS